MNTVKSMHIASIWVGGCVMVVGSIPGFKEPMQARYPSSTLFPFLCWGRVSLLKLINRKKGTLIIKGLLRTPLTHIP